MNNPAVTQLLICRTPEGGFQASVGRRGGTYGVRVHKDPLAAIRGVLAPKPHESWSAVVGDELGPLLDEEDRAGAANLPVPKLKEKPVEIDVDDVI